MNKPGSRDVGVEEKKKMAGPTLLTGERVFEEEKRSKADYEHLSERELLEAAQRGDRPAYGTIVRKYMQAAYFIALGFLHNHQDALDASQDAFVKAFRRIRRFDTRRPFFPWFYRLMRNLCLDRLRRRRRRREVPLENVRILARESEDREMKELLWKSIEELPFEQREVIILRYFRQMSYAEIAEITGRPMGTVMSSLFYAKKKLKGIVAKYIGLDEEKGQE